MRGRQLSGQGGVPDGYRISLTGVSLAPPHLAVGGSGCSGQGPSCSGGGFSFTSAGERCFVALRVVGGQSGDTVTLSMSGHLHCPAGREADCRRFAEKAGADDQTIPIDVPEVPTTPVETTTPTTTPTTPNTSTRTTTTSTTSTRTTAATPSTSAADAG